MGGAEPIDAVVVGSGPNGLAAAITLALHRRSVLLVEGAEALGGSCRSEELTLPGFTHDSCSAVYPLAMASPFFRPLPLEHHGLEWIHPPLALAHPFDDGTAATIRSASPAGSVGGVGEDAGPWEALFQPQVDGWSELEGALLGPLLQVPRHPERLASFGASALRSAWGVARQAFRGPRARALFAGLCAHAVLPLQRPGSAAVGIVLGTLAHRFGWPIPRGGAQRIVDALAGHLVELGGKVQTGRWVEALDELPHARIVLLDLPPGRMLAVAGAGKGDSRWSLPATYRRRVARFRHGPGIFKADFALSGPIPWKAGVCSEAGTVHLGGTIDEIARSERMVWAGEHPTRPFVLLVQPTLFDSSRAPAGHHVAWAYCHVPAGSTMNRMNAIERQIDRFAPGFGDLIIGKCGRTAAEMELQNPNLVGGDIAGGRNTLLQLIARPVLSPTPYRTPVRGLYLCSASTPPGGGVHGMCGWHAASLALRDESGENGA